MVWHRTLHRYLSTSHTDHGLALWMWTWAAFLWSMLAITSEPGNFVLCQQPNLNLKPRNWSFFSIQVWQFSQIKTAQFGHSKKFWFCLATKSWLWGWKISGNQGTRYHTSRQAEVIQIVPIHGLALHTKQTIVAFHMVFNQQAWFHWQKAFSS